MNSLLRATIVIAPTIHGRLHVHSGQWVKVGVSAVALALDPLHYNYEWKPAPFYSKDCHIFSERLARPIRFYNAIDPRYAYNDLFAKLKIVYGDQN